MKTKHANHVSFTFWYSLHRAKGMACARIRKGWSCGDSSRATTGWIRKVQRHPSWHRDVRECLEEYSFSFEGCHGWLVCHKIRQLTGD